MHDDPFEHGHIDGDEDPFFGSIADDGFPVNPDWLRLTSVGIDIGSSTSHLMFSKIIMRRRSTEMSSAFEVVHREVLYRSPILLTPFIDETTIDTDALGEFVKNSYSESGIAQEDVDTGAVICTGEAVRKVNSENIVRMLAAQGGRFVCATAGPNLEAILGAHGSGAVARSKEIGAGMNVDMGGGTTKVAIVQDGAVTETLAISIGARLVAWDTDDKIARVEEAGRKIASSVGIDLVVGNVITQEQKETLAETFADLVMKVLKREEYTPLMMELLVTASPLAFADPIDEVGFSGGVAEYVYDYDKQDYGDLGPLLGAAMRKRLPSMGVPLVGSSERIRATVIGASQYTVQVSTSTVYVSDMSLLPQLDLQVIPSYLPTDDLTTKGVADAIAHGFERMDIDPTDMNRPLALALLGSVVPTYDSIKMICDAIADALKHRTDVWNIILSADVAGLVGSMLKREHKVKPEVIVVDGIQVGDFNFVDLGQSIESVEAIPVVVKSLIFEG
ncbi:MAG: ethanolamine ammonia-lyase reactivating factor EutA [Chloroflexi bacterium]|nr:ethanolamine ammonia-lyase reactivating factor EutA [Chloroflexota bacterium]MCH7655700.1 ethanolamine ammonia-lyase reactivating factor EutA [Chloroflexota bacterium]